MIIIIIIILMNEIKVMNSNNEMINMIMIMAN